MPPQELTALLHLFLSPATDPLQDTYQQHASKLRKLAAAAVETAEKACLSHVSNEGELVMGDTALQDKVARAAYAAAAVDRLTAQVKPTPSTCNSNLCRTDAVVGGMSADAVVFNFRLHEGVVRLACDMRFAAACALRGF